MCDRRAVGRMTQRVVARRPTPGGSINTNGDIGSRRGLDEAMDGKGWVGFGQTFVWEVRDSGLRCRLLLLWVGEVIGWVQIGQGRFGRVRSSD